MQEELAAIREMVGQVLQRQVTRSRNGRGGQPTMPQQLFEMYLKLIGQDISEDLADRIINDVRDELTGEDLDDEEKLRETLLRHLADYIPAAAQAVPQRSPDDRPLTIALVGPTGVGKTTTLAKLAASFKLRHNRKVGLITSDTYRIAAVDQLRTYANIIGLPLQVALTPREMQQCVHSLSDCDVILIDTGAGLERILCLLQGVDAVVQTLGVRFSPRVIVGGTRLFSDSTRILVDAMRTRFDPQLRVFTPKHLGTAKERLDQAASDWFEQPLTTTATEGSNKQAYLYNDRVRHIVRQAYELDRLLLAKSGSPELDAGRAQRFSNEIRAMSDLDRRALPVRLDRIIKWAEDHKPEEASWLRQQIRRIAK
jgi:hypothetical protein